MAKYGPPPAPGADAGPDQLVTVAPGDTAMVTLDGSGSSDPGGAPLIFTWTNSFGTAMGVMPTVSLPAGVHVITLTVDDGTGATDTDTVVITVNQIPVAEAGPDQMLVAPGPAGVPVTLDGSDSSDADGDSLTLTWTGPFGTATGVSPTVTVPGGTHIVNLTVDDGRGGMAMDTVTITVLTLMVAPGQLTATVAQGGDAVSLPFTVKALGGTVSYAIPSTASWLTTNPENGESSGETDTVQAVFDPGRLDPGTYGTSLFVRGGGVIVSRILATLIVTAVPLPIPTPFENGVVDTADFIPFGQPGHAVTPKSVISIFGTGFVAEGEFVADSIPLPTMLGGVMVTFDGIKARLFLVTPTLIIAQLPMGVTLPTATMVIDNGGGEKAVSQPREVPIAEHSPGIFTLTQNGEGQAIVTFAGTADLAAPVGTVGNSRPAEEGDFLTIWCNGLGAVDPPIQDGRNSCDPDGVCTASNVVLHNTVTKPTIRIGGVQVPVENVLFSGASVASVAINEVVFQMPPGTPTGPDVPLTIEIGGVVSKGDVTMAIE